MAVDVLLLIFILVGLPLIAFGVFVVVQFARENPAKEAREREAEKARAEADRAKAAAEGERARQAAAEAVRAAKAIEMRKAYRAWEYLCKAHAPTCTRCGELAYPIPITADRYACPSCRAQFVGAPHTVPLPPPNPDAR